MFRTWTVRYRSYSAAVPADPSLTADELTVGPANEASWDDLQTVLGTAYPSGCQCQRFKMSDMEWRSTLVEDLAERFREQTACGRPRARSTSGLVAYADAEPVGWCAVEPRTAYPRLRGTVLTWRGRDEDMDDDGVWALTCFLTRRGYRRRGVARALARAAVDHARDRGARALEGYPLISRTGGRITTDEVRVGVPSLFAAAGFTEVARPSPRRAVMRIDL